MPYWIDPTNLHTRCDPGNRLRELQHQTDEPGHPALLRALQLIERDLAGSHSVESLARGSYVSGGYLIALFRKRFGMGPMRYVQQRRIKLAQRLLADPYLTVRQVGQLCGYEDPNYFSRTFRKVSGVPPREYRNSE